MDFSALSAYLDEVTARGVPGYALILRLGRETVFEKRCGCAPDGLFWFYSATKLFTCTAAARLSKCWFTVFTRLENCALVR